MENEIIKQMLVSFVRKALFALGAFLVTRNWITPDTAHSLLGDSFVVWLVGLFILVGTTVWQWAKIRFNNKAIKEAIKAPTGTAPSEVKADVLTKESLVTSL